MIRGIDGSRGFIRDFIQKVGSIYNPVVEFGFGCLTYACAKCHNALIVFGESAARPDIFLLLCRKHRIIQPKHVGIGIYALITQSKTCLVVFLVVEGSIASQPIPSHPRMGHKTKGEKGWRVECWGMFWVLVG